MGGEGGLLRRGSQSGGGGDEPISEPGGLRVREKRIKRDK
jgi:hypothetical protein